MVFSLRRKTDARPVAIIDIGSNSIRLVVYQGPGRIPAILFNEKVLAGLGHGLSETGNISDTAMALASQELRRFVSLCGQMDVGQIHCFATAAVRDADNGEEFMEQTRRAGLQPRILKGDEEAKLAAMGVLSAIPGAEGIVADLGGGSLEMALISDGAVQETCSFPVGVLRIQSQLENNPAKLQRQISSAIAGTDWTTRASGMPLYLVGGSWRALARVDMHDSQYPLPVIHQYRMAPTQAGRMVNMLAQIDKSRLKAVPGLSGGRIPNLYDAAWLLSLLTRILKPSDLIVSAFGVREGILFDALSDEERLADPLIAATREAGSAQARFPANSDLLGEWIAGVFVGDPPEWQRIRMAACHLGDVAWRANPNFRAERGLELGLHGNWVGISGAEREMLGQALFTSFGGGNSVFKGGGTLAGAEATQRAIAWGLAMRLGQRFSGGTRKPLENSRLFVKDDHLVLEINTNHAALYGETVARRHRQLGNMLGLRSKMQLV